MFVIWSGHGTVWSNMETWTITEFYTWMGSAQRWGWISSLFLLLDESVLLVESVISITTFLPSLPSL